MDTRQYRYCRSIACTNLDGLDCKIADCSKKDKSKAIKDRIEKLKDEKGVKHGG